MDSSRSVEDRLAEEIAAKDLARVIELEARVKDLETQQQRSGELLDRVRLFGQDAARLWDPEREKSMQAVNERLAGEVWRLRKRVEHLQGVIHEVRTTLRAGRGSQAALDRIAAAEDKIP